VLYNLKENAPKVMGRPLPPDAWDELDTHKNVEAYCNAIRALGHEVTAYEGNEDLVAILRARPVDICFNTCEGFRGDSREAQIPALLEMMGIPYTAGKVMGLAITLDKAMTKRVLGYHGLPTPHFQEFSGPDAPLDDRLKSHLARGGALFVKPNREGTGIGIGSDAMVRDPLALRQKIAYLLESYDQSVLVEAYVRGRDVTCGLVGNFGPDGSTDDIHLFPISEVDYSHYPPGTEPFYSHKLKVDLADDYRYFCPAPLPEAIAAEVRALTLETARVCGALDMARVDFRLDADDGLRPKILEINALPGITPISDMTLCAEADGWTHADLVRAVFSAGAQRHGLFQQSASRLVA
jgi:D-alanine-D-alanine ligase